VAASEDIRKQLRQDHEQVLAELDALAAESDDRAAADRLERLRRAWVIHALCVETVVFPAVGQGEAATSAGTRSVFDKLARAHPGSLWWYAGLQVARDLIRHHVKAECEILFPQLEQRFAAAELEDIGRRFELARDKLTLLEEAKAA
jgi:iron-sulfur cluster repair protein YtfE (RIC family)